MCLESLRVDAFLPKKVRAYKEFLLTPDRDKDGKQILRGRHIDGRYVRGKVYQNAPVNYVLEAGYSGDEYQPGYHAYVKPHKANWKPDEVRLFLVELQNITAAGRQNNADVYVAQTMKIIRQVKA